MTQFAWYVPELNAIVLQSFMEGCYIAFEWGNADLLTVSRNFPFEPLDHGDMIFIPLGQL